MGKKRNNPFRPNWGITPPHRAGHEAAAFDLFEMVDCIADREAVGGVILYGPRGTGKTVLLAEMRERAKKLKVPVIRLKTGMMTGKPKKLGGMLTPWRWFHRLAIRRLTAMFPWGGGAGVEFEDPATSPVDRALRLLLKDPLLLMVDEAHEMPPDFAKVLLQVSQDCISEGLPLLVALAGTPGIEASLSRAHVSFWERSHLLLIGRLESRDDIRAALSVPAEREGMPFADDALEFLAAESQGYPFFIQLLGARSWKAAVARDPNADRILLEDAQAGVSMAETARNVFYRRRRQEIIDRDMRSEALAVSKAFAVPGTDVLSRAELGAVLSPALTRGRTVDGALKELSDVGLVWETDASEWEPGIPSLCTFLTKHMVID